VLNEKPNTFKNKLPKRIVDFFQRHFRNLGYLPRWIIICIDIVLLAIAILITHLIISNLTFGNYDVFSITQRYAIIIFTNLFCFFVYRTYAGIIRYSTIKDALRLLQATFTAFVILVAFNYFHYFINGNKVFLIPLLAVNFIVSFILLLAFRIAVKFVFERYLLTAHDNFIRVAIYGVNPNSVALANALSTEIPKRYCLVGFIDQKDSKLRKELLGVPVVSNGNSDVADVLKDLKANAIIISDKSIDNEEKLKIVEQCLENGYEILTLPTISDWNKQKKLSEKIKKFQIKDLLERSPIVIQNDVKIKEQLKDKVLLVTGAAGSIGEEIVYQIIAFNPQKIILLDQAETPLYRLNLILTKFETKTEIISLIGDIKDKKCLEYIFKTYRPEVIYHAAAYKHVPLMEENPYQAIVTNILGTKNLADLAVQYSVERFVMISTDKAVNPSSIMGASKRIAEIYVQSRCFDAIHNNVSCTRFITTRFGNVLGSNGSVVPLFTKQIEEGGPVTVTHPDIIRYFMTISEACQLVLEAGAMGNGGEIYLFDMGKPVKIIDLAKKMIRLAGFVPGQDIDINIIGLRPGEKLYEELLNDKSKTLPTYHEKIMIAIESKDEKFEEIKAGIELLEKAISKMDIEQAVLIMKRMVPEFKSLNSIHEVLDKKDYF
jgi:FlaA1/EpsC-like NDP-sugar epimerase